MKAKKLAKPQELTINSDPPYGINYARSGGERRFTKVGVTKAAKLRGVNPIVGDDRPFDPPPWLVFGNVLLWVADHFYPWSPLHRHRDRAAVLRDRSEADRTCLAGQGGDVRSHATRSEGDSRSDVRMIRDLETDAERLTRIADVLDPHVKRWIMLTDSDMTLAALVLRVEVQRLTKAAAKECPMRPEPS